MKKSFRSNPIVVAALLLVPLFLAGCATESSVPLPATLVVPRPVRLVGPTQIKSIAEVHAPAVRLDIGIDVSRVEKPRPNIRAWAEYAATVCQDWYPVLCAELASDGFQPRHRLTLVFVPHHFAPAQYDDGRIIVSTDDLCRNLSDYGMMIHELTHAVQDYPPIGEAAWLMEGIADYTRFYLYEVDPTHGGIHPGESSYTDSYRATACFLDYLVRNYDANIVRKFNAALRRGNVTNGQIKKIVAEDPEAKNGERQSIDALFAEFIADWAKNGTIAAGPG